MIHQQPATHMRLPVILALLAPLCACRAPSGAIDYHATADAVALYRQDVLDVIYLADPETQAKVYELAAAIERVETALRLSDAGSASSAASVALAIAEALVLELAPNSEVRFYIALAKIALRHVQAGAPGDVVPPDENTAAAEPQRPSK